MHAQVTRHQIRLVDLFVRAATYSSRGRVLSFNQLHPHLAEYVPPGYPDSRRYSNRKQALAAAQDRLLEHLIEMARADPHRFEFKRGRKRRPHKPMIPIYSRYVRLDLCMASKFSIKDPDTGKTVCPLALRLIPAHAGYLMVLSFMQPDTSPPMKEVAWLAVLPDGTHTWHGRLNLVGQCKPREEIIKFFCQLSKHLA